MTDRSALLAEELADAQRELEYKNIKPAESSVDGEQIRASLEAKYEVRVNELVTRLADLEKDRNETEAAMSRSLQQKAQEVEALRQAMEASSKSQGVSEEEMDKLKQTIEDLQRQVRSSQEQLLELDLQKDRVNDLEVRVFVKATISYSGCTTGTAPEASLRLRTTLRKPRRRVEGSQGARSTDSDSQQGLSLSVHR